MSVTQGPQIKHFKSLLGFFRTKAGLFVLALLIAFVAFGSYSAFASGSRYSNKIVTRFVTTQKIVFLTFDDGPYGTESEGGTKQIVDILDKNGVHATFFLVGARAEKSPNAARYIVAKGNEIGLHSYSHQVMKSYTMAQCRAETQKSMTVMKALTGTNATWFRAPQGKVSKNCLSVISKNGLLYANWTGGTIDTNSKSSASQIVSLAMKYVRPGAIILLHETNPKTAAALPSLIQKLKAKGYKISTMSASKATKTGPILAIERPSANAMITNETVSDNSNDFTINSSTLFSFVKPTIYNAAGEIVLDSPWVVSAPTNTYTFSIPNLSSAKLAAGSYFITGTIMDVNGQQATAQRVPFEVKEVVVTNPEPEAQP
jgi:peptidoglycan-N-acetylglucosamine deacetylase